MKTSKQLLLTKRISELSDNEIAQILKDYPIPKSYQYRKPKYDNAAGKAAAKQVAAIAVLPKHDSSLPDLSIPTQDNPYRPQLQLAAVLEGRSSQQMIDRANSGEYPTLEDHLSGRSPSARPYFNTTNEWLHILKEKVMTEVAALNAHVTGLGDRLRTIVDLTRFIQGLDMAKVSDLFKQLQAIATAATLKDKISATVSFLATLATFTASEMDDQIVAFLTKIVNSGAIDVLLPLVEKLLQAKAEASIATDDALAASVTEADVAATGIDIGTLIAFAKLIAQLLDMFKK